MRNSNPYDGRNTPRDPGARVTKNIQNEADPDEIKEDIGRTRAKMDRTLDELTDKLRPRRWIEEALDAIRSSSAADSLGEAAMAGARTVCRDGARLARRHPIPAALLVGGLAWIAIEQITGKPVIARHRRDRHWSDETQELDVGMAPTTEGVPARPRGSVTGRPVYGGMHPAGFGRGTDYAESGARSEPMGQSVRELASKATDKVSGALHRTADVARSATHRARDAAHNAADRLSDVVHHTADRARDAGERVRHVSQQASHLATDTAHRVSTGARIAQERGRETVESHPLAVAGATFGLGLLAGVALPSSRREDRWFGEEADDVKGAARRIGEEALERGKERGKEVAAAVREEAQRQGLTAQELKHRGERILETAEHEAKRAVKDELSSIAAGAEARRGAEGASGAQGHEQSSMVQNKPGEHCEPGQESSI